MTAASGVSISLHRWITSMHTMSLDIMEEERTEDTCHHHHQQIPSHWNVWSLYRNLKDVYEGTYVCLYVRLPVKLSSIFGCSYV